MSETPYIPKILREFSITELLDEADSVVRVYQMIGIIQWYEMKRRENTRRYRFVQRLKQIFLRKRPRSHDPFLTMEFWRMQAAERESVLRGSKVVSPGQRRRQRKEIQA